MERKLSTEQIRKHAKALDDAIEERNIEGVISYFCDDCEMDLLGIKLNGKEGLRKLIGWMYKYLKDISAVTMSILWYRSRRISRRRR